MAPTVQFSEYGGTDVLAVVDAPALTAGPGQVRIEVRAAGINPIDWKIMRGFMREMIPLTLPAGLGSDVAGVVDQVGAGVTEFQVGDEVMGRSLTPAIAESALKRKIGARGLRMIIEELMLELMYNLPSQKKVRE